MRDSVHMHYLGCDDGPNADRHYTYDYSGEGCSQYAQNLVLHNDSLKYRPRTVGRMVVRDRPHCTVYEDGTYEDNSTH